MLPHSVIRSIWNVTPGAYRPALVARSRIAWISGDRQARVGDHPGVDRVAEVDDPAAGARHTAAPGMARRRAFPIATVPNARSTKPIVIPATAITTAA